MDMEINPDPDGLVDELRDHLMDTGFMGLSLKHPLVFQVPFWSCSMANKALKFKRQEQRRKLEEGDWSGALWLFERPYRMAYLIEWWKEGSIPMEAIRKVIPSLWMDTEFPHQYRQGDLLGLFRAAGFLHDYEEDPRVLGEELTVYRGTGPDPQEVFGVSWTTDRAVAVMFALRFRRKQGGGRIHRVDVPVNLVLGMFQGRGEAEVVVDTDAFSMVLKSQVETRRVQ